MSRGTLPSLGKLRLIRGLETLLTDGQAAPPSDAVLWIRGPRLETREETIVRMIPWQAFYEVLEGGEIRPRNRRLPEGRLPAGTWEALVDFLQPRMQAPALSGKLSGKVNIRLQETSRLRETNMIHAATNDWLEFGIAASELRLKPLIWTMDASQPDTVFIRGTPLPPLPGMQYVEQDGVAVPAGFHWRPEVSAETLRRSLGTAANEMVILRRDPEQSSGGVMWTRVPRTAWLPGKRSTIRLVLNQRRGPQSLQKGS